MKRLFFAAVVATASTVSFAQSATVTTTETKETPAIADAQKNEDERRQIKIEDLPAAVRKELNTVQYKGWSPTVAYWVREDKLEYYEITLVMADESKKVKYNAEGSKLD